MTLSEFFDPLIRGYRRIIATMGDPDRQCADGGETRPAWPADLTCRCGRAIPCRHCESEGR